MNIEVAKKQALKIWQELKDYQKKVFEDKDIPEDQKKMMLIKILDLQCELLEIATEIGIDLK